ncbi:MAG TPA: SMI1/KNR4 family protein, partial [Symbiobacteriaceae bacterium]|nr:SMI1/KNR4 family protein [Symbiobacteriaceae bacterium]
MFKLSRLFHRSKAHGTEQGAGQGFDRFHQHFSADLVAPGATELDLQLCRDRLGQPIPRPLADFLRRCNGGYFGGGLLHVMGASRALRHQDLATWNQPFDWKAALAGFDLHRYVFFADDVFGNQFGYVPGEDDPPVVRFDIQVGEFTEVCPQLSLFLAEMLVEDGSW